MIEREDIVQVLEGYDPSKIRIATIGSHSALDVCDGAIEEGCAPAWDAASKTLDFEKWDKRFAPLLDGSAFADLPRKGARRCSLTP